MIPHRDAARARMRATISRNVRELREFFDITQRELGEVFSPPLTHAAIGQWETGDTSPDIDRLATMAQHFGVPVQFFVFFDESASESLGLTRQQAIYAFALLAQLTPEGRAAIAWANTPMPLP